MSVSGITTSSQVPITYTKREVPGKKAKNDGSRTDTLTLTKEAQEFLKTQKELENASITKKDERKDDFQRFMESLTKENEDDKSSSFLDIAKCMKIARRIQNGDKVPLKDIKFLAKKEPKLYMMAMTFKRNDNPKPKKYKTVLDKKDSESDDSRMLSQTESAGGGMSVEALAEGLGECGGESCGEQLA